MVSIIDTRITEISAKRMKWDTSAKGMNVKIDIIDVKERGNDLVLVFNYSIDYEKDVAFMSLSAETVLSVSPSEKKEVLTEWKSKRNLPVQFAEEILAPITYTGTTIGTLLAFALNIQAPLNLPRPRLQPGKASPAA
ncbi:MAG: hypothetical protein V1834_04195 [Candidatus Micrarchaeota archaeon]